jgi:hypothetical protein
MNTCSNLEIFLEIRDESVWQQKKPETLTKNLWVANQWAYFTVFDIL